MILLLPDDGIDGAGRVRLRGRRLRHVLDVHRAAPGDELRVGLLGGGSGSGRVLTLTRICSSWRSGSTTPRRRRSR